MKCKGCGLELEEGFDVCAYCGRRLSDNGPGPRTAMSAAVTEKEPPRQPETPDFPDMSSLLPGATETKELPPSEEIRKPFSPSDLEDEAIVRALEQFLSLGKEKDLVAEKVPVSPSPPVPAHAAEPVGETEELGKAEDPAEVRRHSSLPVRDMVLPAAPIIFPGTFSAPAPAVKEVVVEEAIVEEAVAYEEAAQAETVDSQDLFLAPEVVETTEPPVAEEPVVEEVVVEEAVAYEEAAQAETVDSQDLFLAPEVVETAEPPVAEEPVVEEAAVEEAVAYEEAARAETMDLQDLFFAGEVIETPRAPVAEEPAVKEVVVTEDAVAKPAARKLEDIEDELESFLSISVELPPAQPAPPEKGLFLAPEPEEKVASEVAGIAETPVAIEENVELPPAVEKAPAEPVPPLLDLPSTATGLPVETSSMATTSLVIAIASYVMVLPLLLGIGPLFALIEGWIARKNIVAAGDTKGKGTATLAMLLGVAGLLLALLFWVSIAIVTLT